MKILSPIIEALAMHPGVILDEEFMKPLNLSQYELARSIGVTPMRINEIARGKRAITAETAILLSEYFKNTPTFWMNMQVRYDLAMEMKKRRALKPKIETKKTVRK